MKFTREQIKGAMGVLEFHQEEAELIDDYYVESVKFLAHPQAPETLYLRVHTNGIKGGELFNDVDYSCVDTEGNVSSCATMFNTMKERVAFYSDFQEIDIKGNKIKIKR